MHDVLIAHAEPVRPAMSVRSTLLQSSLASLRSRGHFDAWNERVAPRYRSIIVEAIAPTWMPIEVGVAHYQACEDLALPLSEQIAMGEAVSERIQGTFMATLLRGAGLNPLVLFRQFDRLWARILQGGSVQLTQTGPKDLDIEILGLPLVDFPYFRIGFTGVVRAGFAFAGVKKHFVKQQSYDPRIQSFVMHAAWV